ncbi:unnamed protein product [Brassica oleracea]|uniref:NB-ARC domain-containing protein n=1 Tax=Brassica oleracea TaxID=3712 RepID=A0A3P6C3M6_BRAOL|nr:unnamed protein product [Brassica oleracea]
MGGCLSVSLPFDQAVTSESSHAMVMFATGVKEGYIHNVEENLTALETTFEELKAMQDDLSRRVEREEDKGLRRLAQVQEVRNLKANGVFEQVADKAQASAMVERPIQPTIDFYIQKMQEEIAKKLSLAGQDWNQKDEDQKACDILNVLKRKKFVLLLDDIWAKFDLMKIGVPYPSRENRCKVVFTTRSLEVCGGMGADVEIPVKCLPPHDALELFKKKVGEIMLGSHPNIPELASIVAKTCEGLSLALKVIGKTMACKRTIQLWQHAIDDLTYYAAVKMRFFLF